MFFLKKKMNIHITANSFKSLLQSNLIIQTNNHSINTKFPVFFLFPILLSASFIVLRNLFSFTKFTKKLLALPFQKNIKNNINQWAFILNSTSQSGKIISKVLAKRNYNLILGSFQCDELDKFIAKISLEYPQNNYKPYYFFKTEIKNLGEKGNLKQLLKDESIKIYFLNEMDNVFNDLELKDDFGEKQLCLNKKFLLKPLILHYIFKSFDNFDVGKIIYNFEISKSTFLNRNLCLFSNYLIDKQIGKYFKNQFKNRCKVINYFYVERILLNDFFLGQILERLIDQPQNSFLLKLI